MHTSVKLETPCEFINITPINPLISKCQIKVCYVGEEPNRNGSVITKEVATEMANSLPGSPIVGKYVDYKEDFEEHNRIISLKDGEWVVTDDTRPYGFVDLNAKVWFQKFLDDGVNEREYLVTEGYLWTGQYPECQRIIEKGNNQSMELSEQNLDAHWTKDENGKPEFFIINEAIISKLCILGEDVEPCFEGANITNIQFSFGDSFKEQLFSMMKEMQKILDGGNTPMYTKYAVEIGDALWCQIMDYLRAQYPDEDGWTTMGIDGIYEEGGNKFVIVREQTTGKYYRINFVVEPEFSVQGEAIEVEKSFEPVNEEGVAAPQFSAEAVAEYRATVDSSEPETPEVEIPESEPAPEEDKIGQYNLDEIPEYIELTEKFNQLTTDYAALEQSFNELKATAEQATATIGELTEFKNKVERQEKQAMIDSFYMLSDEAKADVVANIDNYSLDDIEAKLSVICVRNKVSFALENEPSGQTIVNLDGVGQEDTVPDWVKAVEEVAKNME